ncbi:glycosyltransferase family 4 protein [Prochlorococcus marinus XMU1411]|uniref:glycosyltransferase n=1 Tax=Prochlorococcus marinus TaxID=1219 RepID=UPI001ADCF430|nr:glycosyltransferase [Prochlorococcus marinus]MBO8244205.1 glycosyltransferase family 4 protein [Prochlorococcus marinus XMU1411]MCR8537033.1 glycosyltransferase [Prochlorococcus marinus CUG1430]
MSVYSPIENDGRVKRSIESLREIYSIYLFSPSNKFKEKYTENDVVYISSRITWNKLPTSISLIIFYFELFFYSILIKPKIIYGHDRYLCLITFVISRLFNSKTIYDAHELLLPEKKYKLNIFNLLLYFTEKFCLSKFDILISANKERAAVMKRHFKLKNLPLSIRNISQSTIGTISPKEIKEKYIDFEIKPDQKYLVYSGYFAEERGLNFFIDLLKILPLSISLVLIGSGPAKKNIELLKKSNSIFYGRIHIINKIPNSHLQDVLSFFDLGLIYYSNININNILCSPNKVYEYAHAGIPVIGTGQKTLSRLIDGFEIGKTIKQKQIKSYLYEFSKNILEVLADYDYYKFNLKEFIKENRFYYEKKKLLRTVLQNFES